MAGLHLFPSSLSLVVVSSLLLSSHSIGMGIGFGLRDHLYDPNDPRETGLTLYDIGIAIALVAMGNTTACCHSFLVRSHLYDPFMKQ
jgi:hypothetical protein